MEAVRWPGKLPLGSPRRVLGVVLSACALLTVALGILAWRLFEQERSLGVQRMRDRMEQAVDRANAALLNSLATESDQLATLAHATPAEATHKAMQLVESSPDNLLLLFTEDSVTSYPDHRLLYSPAAAEADAPLPPLAEADAAEFQSQSFAKATNLLLPLTRAGNPAIRCGALLRLARIQRKSADVDAALVTYRQLEEFGMTAVDGLPAELLARHARCDLLTASGARSVQQREVEALAADLRGARWPLTRGAYLFYGAEARRLGAAYHPQDPNAIAIADSVETLWKEWQDIRKGEAVPNGQRSLRMNNQQMVMVWSSSAERLAGRVAGAGYVERRWLGSSVNAQYVRVGISGPEGLPILPLPAISGSPRVSRTLTNSPLQWTLQAASTNPQADFARMAAVRNLLFGGLAFVIFLTMAGGYAIARAVSRELEVARLQSDFVSAVSHEFRTPLTTLQQLSELLAKGRVPREERRQHYYDVISRETRRLHRLVEDLLDFGRMEAGAAVYRPKAIEVRDFLAELVDEFRAGAECRGYRVVLDSGDAGVFVAADPEALRRALWNLLDNAIKYSPGGDTVWVEAKRQNNAVTICVRDRGIGIAAADQRRVFRKFVRGAAAKEASIRGTGLGLAMVHHIVRAHRGEIRLQSEPGQGSALTIVLPAHGHGISGHGASVVPESEGA